MRKSKRAKEKFNEILGDSTNFITPDVIDYYQTDKYYIELSKGVFMKEKMYGVTVLDTEGNHLHDKSQSFKSMKDAEEYIKEELS